VAVIRQRDVQGISKNGGPIDLRRWWETDEDGTCNREEGMVDTSGSHRGVSGKNG